MADPRVVREWLAKADEDYNFAKIKPTEKNDRFACHDETSSVSSLSLSHKTKLSVNFIITQITNRGNYPKRMKNG